MSYAELAQSIAVLCQRLKKNPPQVIAVSKGQPLIHIISQLKIPGFPIELGESYLDELTQKKHHLQSTYPHLRWHFIGAIQSRKIPELCRVADCLHGVSRVSELEKISVQSVRPEFYIQINISRESNKRGANPDLVPELMQTIDRLGLLDSFQGFMGIAQSLESCSHEVVRSQFAELRKIRDHFAPQKKLNMGMSSDYEIAIEEGSNVIRLGTLLFGERRLKN